MSNLDIGLAICFIVIIIAIFGEDNDDDDGFESPAC